MYRCWVHSIFDPNCPNCRKIEAAFTIEGQPVPPREHKQEPEEEPDTNE